MRAVPRRRRRIRALGLLVSLIVTACGGNATTRGPEERDHAAVRVASFNFAESELLGELFAQVLEVGGVSVERFPALGSRETVLPSVQAGLVDVVPEYVASALEFVTLGQVAPGSSGSATYELRKALADRGVTVLDYALAVDRNAIAMRAEAAKDLGIETVSDLRSIASTLNFIGPPECSERPSCLPALERVYGLHFKSFTPVAAGLPIALQLEAGEADVGVAFTSDPLVEEHGLVLLESDREQPRAENIVPLVRTEVLSRHPEVRGLLEGVTFRLGNEALLAMNKRVVDGIAVNQVAHDWLVSEGLA
jgi:osmoprotectant transport system substrate-binding protein